MRMLPTRYACKPKPLHGQEGAIAERRSISRAAQGPVAGDASWSTGRPADGDHPRQLRRRGRPHPAAAPATSLDRRPRRHHSRSWRLIPYYGSAERSSLAASNGELCDAQTATVVKGGFTSNDWHWTSSRNLGEPTTPSWSTAPTASGSGTAALPTPTRRRSPSPTCRTPTRRCVTVAAGDIGKFTQRHDGRRSPAPTGPAWSRPTARTIIVNVDTPGQHLHAGRRRHLGGRRRADHRRHRRSAGHRHRQGGRHRAG